MTNQEILDKVDKVVLGHTNAKKAIINCINRSQKRYQQIYRDLVELENCVPNTNLLLIGGTGTGKTLLVETITHIMGVPTCKFDASSFNPASNREGLNVDSVIKQIYKYIQIVLAESKGKAPYFSEDGIEAQTIVHIDEFDKMCRPYGENDGWVTKTQSEFLALFENKCIFSNLTFIFTGAFSKLELNKPKSLSIGFSHQPSSKSNEHDLDESLIKFGIIPEMLGRIENVVVLDKLEKPHYLSILNQMLMPKMQKTLKAFGINDYYLTKLEQDDLIKRVMESGLGVRGLKRELTKITQELEFNAYLDNDFRSIP